MCESKLCIMGGSVIRFSCHSIILKLYTSTQWERYSTHGGARKYTTILVVYTGSAVKDTKCVMESCAGCWEGGRVGTVHLREGVCIL